VGKTPTAPERICPTVSVPYHTISSAFWQHFIIVRPRGALYSQFLIAIGIEKRENICYYAMNAVLQEGAHHGFFQ
jgi:hypothetical protein